MKLSVIIPTKNDATMLKSILSQLDSPPETEVLVIDAHSTDSTHQVAQEAGARFLTCDGDLSAAKNFGAQLAQGEWLFFLDADQDFWSTTPLQDILQWLSCHTCDATTGSIEQAPGTAGFVSHVRESIRNLDIVLSGGYTLIKRDVFWHLDGFRTRMLCIGLWEDYDLSLRVKLGGYNMMRMPFTLVHKRPFQQRLSNGMVLFPM